MHPKTNPGFFQKQCDRANTFPELVSLAKNELDKFPVDCRIEIVCGPISTGGYGNKEDNLRVFSSTINGLLRHGSPVFNQMPYEERLSFFRQRWLQENPERANQYYQPILEKFYLPLIETRRFKIGRFIPGWHSSFGSRWEWVQLFEHGAGIYYFTEEEITQFLSSR